MGIFSENHDSLSSQVMQQWCKKQKKLYSGFSIWPKWLCMYKQEQAYMQTKHFVTGVWL